MFDNIEPRWIKKIIVAVVIGFLTGEIITKVLGIFLTAEKWTLFLELWIPLCIISGLVYVLKKYTDEEDDTMGANKFQ